jgi:hypothetical protein
MDDPGIIDSSHPAAAAAAAAAPEEEDPLSEPLFHSCISASGFFADETTSHEADNNKTFKSDVKSEPITATDDAAAIEDGMDEEQQLVNANIISGYNSNRANTNGSNGNSNSSSISSWSHLPPKSSSETAKVNSINFSRDRTCLILSTSHGVRIRTLESSHYTLLHNNQDTTNINRSSTANIDDSSTTNNEWIYDILFPYGATYAQLLHTTSTLAVILPNSPRCCFLYDAKNAVNPLSALPMSAAVKRVELTSTVLVCVTADGRLHVFHMNDGSDKQERPVWIQTLNIMHPSDSVRNITRGHNIFFSGSYFDLSPNEEEPYLVCKSFNGTAGTIRVYDPTQVSEIEVSSGNVSVYSGVSGAASAHSGGEIRKKVRRRCHLHTTIDAHEHSVTRMLTGKSSSSSFVATASSRGTTIRVFGLPHGQQLWEWHRGSRSCQILSLSWNGLGDRLISYGSSNTIHVFQLNHEQKNNGVTSANLEDSHADARDFEEPHEDHNKVESTNNLINQEFGTKPEKPLFKRIGATLRKHTLGNGNATTPLKHRSFAKLKYQSTGSKDQQQLVVALLDRHDINVISRNASSREDTLVVCTLNGELRQYSVKSDRPFKLAQMEDVLFCGANLASPNTSH